MQWKNEYKERHALDRGYLYVGSCGNERQELMSAQKKEEDGKTHEKEREREREKQIGREREEKQSIYVRTYVAGETSRG